MMTGEPAAAGAGSDSPENVEVNVKFKGQTIPVSLSLDSTVKDLKSLLQPLTDVLPRGQKLILKGKVLVDVMTLRSSEVSNGAKIMLLASQGLHQGDGPIRKETQAVSNLKRPASPIQKKIEINQLERWKATGIVALSEWGLKGIPDEVWTCGAYARVLDLSHNSIQEVPTAISSWCSLKKLLLNDNAILDESFSWEGLKSLKLEVLSLSQNCLTTMTSALGTLTSLKQLHIANNKLTCIPGEIGLLVQLEVLKANNNRISNIPTCIGSCTSLIEVDLSSNLLAELPETFGSLHKLKGRQELAVSSWALASHKLCFGGACIRQPEEYFGYCLALYLSNNGLKSLPSTLFKMCIQLSTLDIHATEITMQVLRQFEGWEDFDKRRRLKHQKHLDFRAMDSAEFDEGADKS